MTRRTCFPVTFRGMKQDKGWSVELTIMFRFKEGSTQLRSQTHNDGVSCMLYILSYLVTSYHISLDLPGPLRELIKMVCLRSVPVQLVVVPRSYP